MLAGGRAYVISESNQIDQARLNFEARRISVRPADKYKALSALHCANTSQPTLQVNLWETPAVSSISYNSYDEVVSRAEYDV